MNNPPPDWMKDLSAGTIQLKGRFVPRTHKCFVGRDTELGIHRWRAACIRCHINERYLTGYFPKWTEAVAFALEHFDDMHGGPIAEREED